MRFSWLESDESFTRNKVKRKQKKNLFFPSTTNKKEYMFSDPKLCIREELRKKKKTKLGIFYSHCKSSVHSQSIVLKLSWFNDNRNHGTSAITKRHRWFFFCCKLFSFEALSFTSVSPSCFFFFFIQKWKKFVCFQIVQLVLLYKQTLRKIVSTLLFRSGSMLSKTKSFLISM